MWKALINKIFKKAKTAEGLGAIGSGTFFGWIGNISGLVSPKVFAFLGFSFTGINALIPFAAFGAILGYFGVKTFKYWKLRHKVEKMKKKFGWFFLFIKYYNFGFVIHFIVIFMAFVMIIGWTTICSNIGLSDSILELIIVWPLFIIILADIICLVAKIFKRSFKVD